MCHNSRPHGLPFPTLYPAIKVETEPVCWGEGRGETEEKRILTDVWHYITNVLHTSKVALWELKSRISEEHLSTDPASPPPVHSYSTLARPKQERKAAIGNKGYIPLLCRRITPLTRCCLGGHVPYRPKQIASRSRDPLPLWEKQLDAV